MKSSIRRINQRKTTRPVTIIKDTKYIAKISERTIPRRQYESGYEIEQENINHCLNLYAIICVYVALVVAIIIGSGGIVVCIVYFNSEENTQNWKICGIVLGAITCIVTIILIILTVFKQTRNRPWRYKAQDIFLHPEKYFTDGIDQLSNEDLDNDDDHLQDTINDNNNKIVDNISSSVTNTPYRLLKTFHHDQVYCLNCNRLHPTTQECIDVKRVPNRLPPLNRSKSDQIQRDSNAIQTKDKSLTKKKSNKIIDRSIESSLTSKAQTDVLENTKDNIILRRVTIPGAKAVVKQPNTKFMIVRVPNVAGELVIQPKEH